VIILLPGDNTAVTQPCYRRTYDGIILGRQCNNFPLLSHTGEIHNVAPREAPWFHGSDSNLWPHDREADALPLELSGQTRRQYTRLMMLII
jgi:hypothetical protein